MIINTYPSVRVVAAPPVWKSTYTPVAKHFTSHEEHQALTRGITPAEFVRRNVIVKELSDSVRLKPGDTAFPSIKKGYTDWGQCLVVGICRSYKDFAFDAEWPENDSPMIVTFAPLNDRATHIHCTHHYLVAKNPFVVTC